MKIIPIIENTKVDEFESERGLSLYVESNDKKILFDTGESDKVIKNLEKLGIDIHEIDYFIISHGHKDHMGGLIYLLDAGINPEKVIVRRGAVSAFYFKCILEKEIGLSREKLDRIKGINEIEIDNIYRLEKNIYLVSPNKKSSFFYYKEGEKDDFNHEISLVVVEESKLNVVVGCCHLGVESLIDFIKGNFSESVINSLSGGLHTRSLIFRPLALIRYIEFMKKSGIKKYFLGHCTGRRTTAIMKKHITGVDKLLIGRVYDV